jgi:hypothetical protein
MKRRRIGGRYCRDCFAAANRRSHQRLRRERNARRRDRARERDVVTRDRDSARAKLFVAIARGKMRKSPCVICGLAKVTAFIVDPARWWEVVWICREDRAAEMTRRLSTPVTLTPCLEKERDAVRAEVASLPEPLRLRLHAIAAKGPAGTTLAPDAPLYVMQLMRAYRALCAERRESEAASPVANTLLAVARMGELLWEGWFSAWDLGLRLAASLFGSHCSRGGSAMENEQPTDSSPPSQR